jgi:hypothetical protein
MMADRSSAPLAPLVSLVSSVPDLRAKDDSVSFLASMTRWRRSLHSWCLVSV